jgi:hypothetical protein
MNTPGQKRRTVSLTECPCQHGSLTVDPDDSILRRVKILGYESVNRRRYTPQAVQQAVRLYEGVKVNIDHSSNPHASRAYRDRFGKLENITVNEQGMFGDLRFNPEHADAKSVRWFAENMPDALGLSHNATGQGHDEAGIFVVEKIVAVRSVDLVADPATTRGLRESSQFGRSSRQTVDSQEMVSVARTRAVISQLRQEAYEEEWVRQRLRTPEGFRQALFEGIASLRPPKISHSEFKRRLLGQPQRERMSSAQRQEMLVLLLGKDEAKRRLRERRQTEGGAPRDADLNETTATPTATARGCPLRSCKRRSCNSWARKRRRGDFASRREERAERRVTRTTAVNAWTLARANPTAEGNIPAIPGHASRTRPMTGTTLLTLAGPAVPEDRSKLPRVPTQTRIRDRERRPSKRSKRR